MGLAATDRSRDPNGSPDTSQTFLYFGWLTLLVTIPMTNQKPEARILSESQATGKAHGHLPGGSHQFPVELCTESSDAAAVLSTVGDPTQFHVHIGIQPALSVARSVSSSLPRVESLQT